MKKRILSICGAVVVCLAVVLCMVHGLSGRKPEASQGDVKGSEVLSNEGDNEQQFEDSDAPQRKEEQRDTGNPADSPAMSASGDSSVDFGSTEAAGGAESSSGNKEVTGGTESSGENLGSTENSGNTSNEDAGWTGYY